ncbi:MAG: lipopolysaccharide biosynthesis protein [Acidimicrobiales bacterium]
MNRLVSRIRAMDRHQLETVFTSSAFMITAGLTFLNAIMMSRALGDSGRGAVAAVYGNTIVLGWAFQIGVPAAAAYFAKDVDHRRVVMSAWAMTGMFAIPIAAVLTPFYVWLFRGEAFTEGGTSLKLWFIAFVIANLFNNPFLTALFWLRGIGNTVRFNALLALPQVLITLGLAGLFITDTMTVDRALTSTFAAMVGGWAVALTVTKSWPGRGFSKPIFDTIRHYSLRAWVGNLSFFVSLRVDQMVLAGFVPLDELGHYAIAAAVSTLSGPIARGSAQAVLPFVRKAASDEERLDRIQTSLRWVALASFGTLALIGITANQVIPFVFSRDFSASVLPLLILLPGAFATDLTQVYTTALSSFDRPQDASKAQIAAALVTVVGLLTLVSPFGIVGAAITTSISYWVGLAVSVWFWRKLRARVERGEVTGHTERIEDASGEPEVVA